MAPHAPRLFTISASAPFLPTLARALLDGRLITGFPDAGNPLALADATLYLPTQRACRLAQEVFRDAIGTDAAILPRIVAMGDIDEDEIVFAELATGPLAGEALALPRAIEPLERRFILTRLIAKWVEGIRPSEGAPLVAGSPAAVLALADDLARLFDDMTTRKVAWEQLDGLVPREFDVYWQKALELVQIVRADWPAILAEKNAIDAADRRDRLIDAEVARLKRHPGPVIAAGSTGSMPATATLLETIAHLPQGAVVFPGLDTDLDEPAWTAIAGARDGLGRDDPAPAFGHPQFALQALLRKIGVDRAAVVPLAAPAPHGRETLVSEAMRPAMTSERWRERIATAGFADQAGRALATVTAIEAANVEDEALAIAVALREAVEVEGKTAALVTPDRALARRVLAALARWNVPVDDSGGDALADVSAGVFARLAAEVALRGCEPVPLLALLKHPLLRLGAEAGAWRHAIATLEFAVLRGPRPRAGSGGLAHALATVRAEKRHRSDPRTRLNEAELDGAAALIDQLKAALAPMEALARRPLPLTTLADAHRQAITALTINSNGGSAGFSGREGEALSQLFDDVAKFGAEISLAPAEYPETFQALAGGRVVRRPGAPGSRVRILGPLEARLQQADRVVLGGLNEASWPPETRGDPWLSRPMRRALGLDLPERRIGLSAHDFAQMLGAPEIVLTRAAKLAGAPTVASRFLQRLAAVSGAEWERAKARGERYLALARGLDTPAAPPQPCAPPAPRPPLDARPKQLSVTEIEHWLRDPYTIYAKHVLRLAPLDAVDTPPGARDRGSVIHAAIGAFTEKFAKDLPTDPAAALVEIGREQFKALDDYPEARAFWWPRFLRIAEWFADFERRRRKDMSALLAETGGALDIPVGAATFRLTGIADRIERRADGRYTILDYKTGAPPTDKQVRTGLSPQLTLEAAILRGGGFAGIPQGSSVGGLVYVALRGGDPPGEERAIDFKTETPDQQADHALKRLSEVAAKFAQAETPYHSLVHPMWKAQYGEYDHLARVKEWSLSGGEEGGDE